MPGAGGVELGDVLPNHRFDERRLCRYLAAYLEDFSDDCRIRQYQGGQSNPTFHLQTASREFVLRKRPPGRLLPSAHAVDREYRVMRALADTQVPVPRMLHMCEDESVIGQTFFVMQHVPGRVFTDPLMPGASPPERAAVYADMNRVLACLQAVDYREVGLSGFGRPEGYVQRQVARWSKQYAASKLNDLPAMDKLIDWLPKNVPGREETAIVHGDYRLGNLIVDAHEPRIVAVLDWELATLGHPLADLAYNCLAYHLSEVSGRGFGDADLAALGIPDESSYLREFCVHSGRNEIENWRFFVVLALFRIAAILVGVYRRAVDGNAADARALEIAGSYPEIAETAWKIACR